MRMLYKKDAYMYDFTYGWNYGDGEHYIILFVI